jgi:5'-AMP-activated protein kinase catalytic alpha subunit
MPVPVPVPPPVQPTGLAVGQPPVAGGAPETSAELQFANIQLSSSPVEPLAGGTLPALPLEITHYTMKQTLGVGAFGKVKLAEHKETGELFAIKCIQKSRLSAARQFERLQREIRILKMLRHPNVIQLHAVIETDSEIFLVMEHVAGGDLLDFINSRGAMPEDQARDLVGQIMCGLQFCHSLGVAHRDLKPENILIDEDGVVKITDFGLSNMQNAGEHLSTLCGSPYYAAPELLDGSTTRYDGTEADIWSVGVITFAILCGELPFDGQTLPDLFAKITSGAYTIPPQLSLSNECIEMLAQMLVCAPNGRTKMAALRQHPWMTGVKPAVPTSQAKARSSGSTTSTRTGAEAVTIENLNRSALDTTWRERNLSGAQGSGPRVARSLSADAPPKRRSSVDDPQPAPQPEERIPS